MSTALAQTLHGSCVRLRVPHSAQMVSSPPERTRGVLQHQQDPGEGVHKLFSGPQTWEQKTCTVAPLVCQGCYSFWKSPALGQVKSIQTIPKWHMFSSTEGKISADSHSKMSYLCRTSKVAFLFSWFFFPQGIDLMLDFPRAGCCGIRGLGTFHPWRGLSGMGSGLGGGPQCPRENPWGEAVRSISKGRETSGSWGAG